MQTLKFILLIIIDVVLSIAGAYGLWLFMIKEIKAGASCGTGSIGEAIIAIIVSVIVFVILIVAIGIGLHLLIF